MPNIMFDINPQSDDIGTTPIRFGDGRFAHIAVFSPLSGLVLHCAGARQRRGDTQRGALPRAVEAGVWYSEN
jgi:hypothetical protein